MRKLIYGDEAMNAVDNRIRPIGYKEFVLVRKEDRMTERDLDTAIEKCERIMECDTRTLKNPESENGWIFEKIYDLLKFLRQCRFDSDAKSGDMISRQAAIDALTEDKELINAGLDSLTLDYNTRRNEEQRREQIDEDIETIKELPVAQPGWIPCTPGTMPEREGRYVCTYTYDGKKDVFMFRFENGDFLVPWYVETVTAWYKPLDPWEGNANE